MALQLELDVSHEGRSTKVAVRGELDASTAPSLDALLVSLAAEGHSQVVLDLAGLEFADSYGIEPFLRRRNHFASLTLADPARPVRQLLSVLNLPFSTDPVPVEKAAVA